MAKVSSQPRCFRRFATPWAILAFIALPFMVLPASDIRAQHAEMDHTERADGSRISWHLDRRGRNEDQGILFLAQGSGCASPSFNRSIARAMHLAPDMAVLMLEKPGVPHGHVPDDSMHGCPPAYEAKHTVSRWAADLGRVVDDLRDADWWNGELVLFGGSEGGAMISLAAAKIADTDAVIILSSGLGYPFAESFIRVVPPQVAEQAESMFERIRDNPEADESWGGNSFAWWADVLALDFLDHLLRVDAPILMIHGDRDPLAPVDASRKVRNVFREQGRTNLTYREYQGYDHGMKDADGVDRLDEVMREAAEWLRKKGR